MNVDNVPLDMQPQWILDHLQFDVHSSVANSRLTFHNFKCSDFMVQSNNDWPPHFLFDVTYGCAALRTWGVRESVQFAEENTKEFYYHNVDYDDNGGDSDDDDSHNGHLVRDEGKWAGVCWNKTVQAMKGDCHSWTEMPEKAGDIEAADMLDVVVGLWMHNARKDMCQARMIKEE